MQALRRLVAHYERYGEHGRALDYAWRQVELDPWQEEAHLQVMQLLALSLTRKRPRLTRHNVCYQCGTLSSQLPN